jgi:hypothetical protein
MDAFTAYQLHNGIKLHFTSESYDFFKYGGKLKNCTIQTFEGRNDKLFFHKLARKYPDEQNLKFFLASNFFGRKVSWVRELLTVDSEACYMESRRIKESLDYTMKQDLDWILQKHPDFKSALRVSDGELPYLLESMNHRDIHPETVIGLNVVIGFLPVWSSKIHDTIIYPHTRFKLERYAPFLEINVRNVLELLKSRLT